MSARGALARGLARLWFRRLRVEGPPLPPGPVLLVLNHPNGLLDPLVVLAGLAPGPRFLAKATLWKLLPLRPFLALFRPIPVHRAQDGPDGRPDPAATEATFRTVFEAWAQGDRVAIFPEGISHGDPDLAPLKTGAARMVLGSPTPVALVPAGLVYGRRETFRHAVLLKVGSSIAWEDLRGRGTDPEAVKELTARIRMALLPLTLHGEDGTRLALAQDLAWLLRDGPRSRADLEAHRARVRMLLARLQALPPERIEALGTGLAEVRAGLRAAGLRADQLEHPYGWGEAAAWFPKAALRGALALGLAPLALLYLPPYAVLDWLVGRLTDDLDQTATFKLLGGLAFHPLWAGLLGWAGWRLGGTWGLGGALLSLPAALLALPLATRLREDLQAVRGFLARGRADVPALAEARRRLLEAFPELV